MAGAGVRKPRHSGEGGHTAPTLLPSPPCTPSRHLVPLQVVQPKQEVHALLVQHRDGAGQEVGTHLDLRQVDATCRQQQHARAGAHVLASAPRTQPRWHVHRPRAPKWQPRGS